MSSQIETPASWSRCRPWLIVLPAIRPEHRAPSSPRNANASSRHRSGFDVAMAIARCARPTVAFACYLIGVRLRTPICDLLGIEVPIVQAPVSSAPALAAAVSNVGALGMLQLSWLGLEDARAVIRETRRLTARPFGVNLVLDWSQRARLELALERDFGGVAVSGRSVALSRRDSRGPSAVAIHSLGAMEARQAARWVPR